MEQDSMFPNLRIGGLQKTSFIDYPGKISAIVFTQGCNFRCPYCHNPELVMCKNKLIQSEDVLSFLETRKHKLQGVVITGGEPTIHQDLPEFISSVKSMGFLVKLDTNGTNPGMLRRLLDEKLLDFIAMDFKSHPRDYHRVAGRFVDIQAVVSSIRMIQLSGIEHEFRTTVHKDLLSIKDLQEMAAYLNYDMHYRFQQFIPTKCLDETYLSKETYPDRMIQTLNSWLKSNNGSKDVVEELNF